MSEIPMLFAVQWLDPKRPSAPPHIRYLSTEQAADAEAVRLAKELGDGTPVVRFDLPEPREWEVGA